MRGGPQTSPCVQQTMIAAAELPPTIRPAPHFPRPFNGPRVSRIVLLALVGGCGRLLGSRRGGGRSAGVRCGGGSGWSGVEEGAAVCFGSSPPWVFGPQVASDRVASGRPTFIKPTPPRLRVRVMSKGRGGYPAGPGKAPPAPPARRGRCGKARTRPPDASSRKTLCAGRLSSSKR